MENGLSRPAPISTSSDPRPPSIRSKASCQRTQLARESEPPKNPRQANKRLIATFTKLKNQSSPRNQKRKQTPNHNKNVLSAVCLLRRVIPTEAAFWPTRDPLFSSPLYPEAYRRARLGGEPGLVQPLVDAAKAACYSESPTTVESSNPRPYQSAARTTKPTEEYAWPPQ